MSTLTDRQRAILDTLWSDTGTALALDRLCDWLRPIVKEALVSDRDTSPFGVPVLSEEDAPSLTEMVLILATAWVEALSLSDRPRGPGFLSDLDDDLLPEFADLSELFRVGKGLALDEAAVREVFRKLKLYRRRKLPLPREALRLLKAVGFFSKPEPDLPADLPDALDDGDCAFIWVDGTGFVLNRATDAVCHILRVTRTVTVVETGPEESDANPTRHLGWIRERVATIVLNGVIPRKSKRFTLDGFRMFLSQMNLGYLEPRLVQP